MSSPPLRGLSGLIDFDCAARLGSFRLAGAELHKTPAAVSQQIKQLEQALGFALFVRHARHVSITEKGRELAGTVARLLAELNRQITALQQDGDDEALLRITSTHSFAMKWLVPRLHRFSACHPSIDLRVEASDQPVDLDGSGVHVALRYVRVKPGDEAPLYREQQVVVYGPQLPLGRRASSPPNLATLARQPLLYEGTPEAWLRVLDANGVRVRHPDFARSYSHAGLLVQAAAAGQGVAVAPYSLAYEDLLRGRLLRCDCEPLPSAYGYRLLVAAGLAGAPKVRHFREWVDAEIAEMLQHLEARPSHAGPPL